MRKALLLLLACFLALGASKVLADSRTDAMNTDSRFVDDIDLIWLYPNMVTDYKNIVDFRATGLVHTMEWGGFLDGEHTELGVVGGYVFRPMGYDGTRSSYFGGNGGNTNWGGIGSGWYATVIPSWNIFASGVNFSDMRSVYAAGALTAPTPENKVDLFWGNSWDKVSFGVQLNYADSQPSVLDGGMGAFMGGFMTNSSYANTATGAPYSFVSNVSGSRIIGGNLGLGLTDGSYFSQANFHLGFSLGTLTVTDSTTAATAADTFNDTLNDNGIFTLSFGTLLQHDLDQNSNVRIFGDAYIDQNNQTESLKYDFGGDGSYTNDAPDDSELWKGQYSDIVATLGMACNHKVLDGKATITAGWQASWVNADLKSTGNITNGAPVYTYTFTGAAPGGMFSEQNWDNWSINWNVGVEAKVASWLDVRAGLNRPVLSRSNWWGRDDNFAGGTTVKDTQRYVGTMDGYFGPNGNTYAMGFGIHWENWELDATAMVGSVFNSIKNVAPGNGVFYSNAANGNIAGAIITNANADIRYRF